MTLPFLTPLDEASLRSAGVPAPWRFGIADRVRFSELDAIGHVNHTAYLRWFESFRLPYLAARHVTDYGPSSPRLVLREVQCSYLQEMGKSLNDTALDYVVTGRTTLFRTTSFTMEFAVWLPGQPAQCTAEGRAGVVLLNRDAPGRHPIPEAGRAAFLSEDGAVAE